MKKFQHIVCISLALFLTVLSVSAGSIETLSFENSEIQENLYTVSATKNAVLFIDTSGGNTITITESDFPPVTFDDIFQYKARIVAQHIIATLKLQQLTTTSDSSIRDASIKERIFPFHSHW